MRIQYPRWTPNPKTADGLPELFVKDEADFIAKNPTEFEELTAYNAPITAPVGEVIAKAKLEEREECALVAANWLTSKDVAKEIAKAIRARKSNAPIQAKPTKRGQAGQVAAPPKPPTLEEVKASGYTDEAAAAIVEREQGKFERSEEPYGPNPVTGDPVI